MDKAKVRMLSGGAPPKGSCFYETQLVSLTHFHLVPGLTFDIFKLDLLLPRCGLRRIPFRSGLSGRHGRVLQIRLALQRQETRSQASPAAHAPQAAMRLPRRQEG